jgi:hypothetical protein
MTTQGLFTVVRPAIDSDRIYLEWEAKLNNGKHVACMKSLATDAGSVIAF